VDRVGETRFAPISLLGATPDGATDSVTLTEKDATRPSNLPDGDGQGMSFRQVGGP